MDEDDRSAGIASKGGKARAEQLTPERRREIAKLGAQARWEGGIPQAMYGSADRPLRIGGVEIPCYVLDDGRRVLIQRGMMTALDISQGTAGRGGGDRLAKFVATKALRDFVPPDVAEMITNPIRFSVGGSTAYGYEATILADLCDAVLAARREGRLHYQQEHIAEQCEILVRGFARVGIVALVDEATGFQADRARDALASILEAFVATELRKWVKTFPAEFYKQLFRLKGLDFPSNGKAQRPKYFGHLTNNIVYDRLAPGVKAELKRRTPRDKQGRHKHKLHQRLTDDVGHPKLREHLSAVIAVMKLSPDWETFQRNLDQALPKWDDTLPLPFTEGV